MGDPSQTEQRGVQAVLRHYSAVAEREWEIQPVKQGLSGARVWRVELETRGSRCLRRWPSEHPSVDRLRLIHGVMEHLSHAGITFTPTPVATNGGETFVEHAGTLWELTTWMPGRAEYRNAPSPERLRSAMQALAKLHVQAATFRGSSAVISGSPGIADRRRLLSEYESGRLEQLGRAVRPVGWPEMSERTSRILRHFVDRGDRLRQVLNKAGEIKVSHQPCLRDIHDEHVLFEEVNVTGIIDFGAMRYDNVATDVARLLGSMAAADDDAWSFGIAEYQCVRPLSSDELTLVTAFDVSAILLGSLQWLDWIYLQDRQFDQREVVLERIDRLLARLESLRG